MEIVVKISIVVLVCSCLFNCKDSQEKIIVNEQYLIMYKDEESYEAERLTIGNLESKESVGLIYKKEKCTGVVLSDSNMVTKSYFFYEDGSLKSLVRLKGDVRHGETIVYDNVGFPKYRSFYFNGLHHFQKHNGDLVQLRPITEIRNYPDSTIVSFAVTEDAIENLDSRLYLKHTLIPLEDYRKEMLAVTETTYSESGVRYNYGRLNQLKSYIVYGYFCEKEDERVVKEYPIFRDTILNGILVR